MAMSEPAFDPIAAMQAQRDKTMGVDTPPEKKPTKNPNEKFSPDRCKAILGALAGGHFPSTAAALAGIDEKTLYHWVKKGNDDRFKNRDTEYATFAQQFEQASATSEHTALGTVMQAVKKGDTKAAEWLLERRHAERWGRKDKLEVGGDPNQPIVVQLTWPGAPSAAEEEGYLELPEHADDDIEDAEVIEDGGE